MARLDRLGPAKEVAQIGAVIGREFSYDLLCAIYPAPEDELQEAIKALADAELLYVRGIPPESTYTFKHALIQDAAYEALLKARRRELHQSVARVLSRQFSELTERQPELLAHHYTEAGLNVEAIPCWRRAGQGAVERSAHVEAVSHLTKGLELVNTLPNSHERAREELTLLRILGTSQLATKGWGAPEVEATYTRARELCRHVGETAQVFPVLSGLFTCYVVQTKLHTALELGKQLLDLAQREQNPALLVEAHRTLGIALFCLGEFPSSREHSEQGFSFYDAEQHKTLAFSYGQDPGVFCLSNSAVALWHLGHPDQALTRSEEALTLAQRLSHPFSLSYALQINAMVHQLRGERLAAQERTEAFLTLSTEQGFQWCVGGGMMLLAWALAEQGQRDEGIAQIRRGLEVYLATGAKVWQPYYLALLAEQSHESGQLARSRTHRAG
jgi:predicted ATPase